MFAPDGAAQQHIVRRCCWRNSPAEHLTVHVQSLLHLAILDQSFQYWTVNDASRHTRRQPGRLARLNDVACTCKHFHEARERHRRHLAVHGSPPGPCLFQEAEPPAPFAQPPCCLAAQLPGSQPFDPRLSNRCQDLLPAFRTQRHFTRYPKDHLIQLSRTQNPANELRFPICCVSRQLLHEAGGGEAIGHEVVRFQVFDQVACFCEPRSAGKSHHYLVVRS
mmetsp:Transcript_5286/g.12598  ORF Transcript_5286/g.12598 Transcript_5286/m.12598 type:complete len:221 (-) Transcript_5286:1378-2040(-)